MPTVTDCDLVLGYLAEDSFLGGPMCLDKAAAEQAIETHLAKPLGISVADAAWGVHETVTASMAQAAMIHAIERALDVTRFAMLPIGGAGPVHACSLAAKMNIDRLICPMGAGVASAIGMLASAISFEIARAAPSGLDELEYAQTWSMIEEMDQEASALVTGAGVDAGVVSRRLSAMMRYAGQDYEIEAAINPETVRNGDRESLLAAFTEAYRRRYGRSEEMAVEILSWRLAVEGPRSGLGETLVGRKADSDALGKPIGHRAAWFDDQFYETPVYKRSALSPNVHIKGPAIVEETESTTIIPPEFELSVDRALNLVLTRVRP